MEPGLSTDDYPMFPSSCPGLFAHFWQFEGVHRPTKMQERQQQQKKGPAAARHTDTHIQIHTLTPPCTLWSSATCVYDSYCRHNKILFSP